MNVKQGLRGEGTTYHLNRYEIIHYMILMYVRCFHRVLDNATAFSAMADIPSLAEGIRQAFLCCFAGALVITECVGLRKNPPTLTSLGEATPVQHMIAWVEVRWLSEKVVL